MRIGPVDPVVAGHDSPRPPLAHGDLEACEIDLVQSPLVDHGVPDHPQGLLAVRGEVLGACCRSGRFDAADVRGGEPAGQERILGEVLEIPAAQRRPFDVQSRSQHDVDSQCDCLSPQGRPDPLAQLGSQLFATVAAVGKQVVSSEACCPRWSPSPTCRRMPCGPSERTRERSPALGFPGSATHSRR